MRRRLDEIIAKHTGKTIEKVSQDTERDYFMSSEEAKEYGIIDRVISRALGSDGRMARPTDSNEQLLC